MTVRGSLSVAALVVASILMAPTRLPAQQVDWGALNPAFKGATVVNKTATCQECHRSEVRAFEGTTHARAFRNGKMPAQGECESCHGPRSKHAEEPGVELSWDSLTVRQQSAVCLQCHEGGARLGWKGGAHLAANTSCTSCHSVMVARSEARLLAWQA